ncbi:MAG: hypothetical protein M3Z02_08650 [Actinomycetota bacterium]|nr:hypothetical protein [Actinomycetota bacterium]
MLTVLLIVLAVGLIAALIFAAGGFGRRSVVRRTLVERPVRRTVVEDVPVRRRVVEEDVPVRRYIDE